MKSINHIIIKVFLNKLRWLQTPNRGKSFFYELGTRHLTATRHYDRGAQSYCLHCRVTSSRWRFATDQYTNNGAIMDKFATVLPVTVNTKNL